MELELDDVGVGRGARAGAAPYASVMRSAERGMTCVHVRRKEVRK